MVSMKKQWSQTTMVSTETTDTAHRELTSQNKLEHWIPCGKKGRKQRKQGWYSSNGQGEEDWLLIEGTVCGIGLISHWWKTKQERYRGLRAGIKHQYPDYKVNQVNVVFDFLAEYHQSLKNDLNEHLTLRKERRRDAISNNEKPEMDHITKRWIS